MFITLMVEHIEHRPELLRLDALGHGVLKARLEPEERLAFTRAYEDQVRTGGGILDRMLALPPGRGAQLLMRTYGLIRGLRQSFDEASCNAACAMPGPRFSDELREALTEYWRGALSAPRAGERPST